MAHFAELDASDKVMRVIVIDNNNNLDPDGNENELYGAAFCRDLLGGSKWVQCSYNRNFRVHFPGRGWTYDSNRDAFIPPQPYPSWVLNESTLLWNPPISPPADHDLDNLYTWNEYQQRWDAPE
jgi:hypothetical protein